MTLAQLGAALQERWPDRDAMALSQTVRARLALVQTPPRGVWGASGPAKHTTLETWLGRGVDGVADVDAIVLRYLAAFGPATVADVQTWSGLSRLREVVDRLGALVVAFRDEDGREAFDLPDAPRPTPTRRHRPGCSTTSTTCCCRTPTAAGSSPTATAPRCSART